MEKDKVTSFLIVRQSNKTLSYLYVTERGRGNINALSIGELREKVLARGLPWYDQEIYRPNIKKSEYDNPIYGHPQTKHSYDTTQLYKCPKCGCLLYLKDREDGSGEFYHCEYCDDTYSYEYVQSFAKYHGPRSILDECPRCGSGIIKKEGGPRGIFFGCEEFPECDFAYSELLRQKYTPKQDI